MESHEPHEKLTERMASRLDSELDAIFRRLQDAVLDLANENTRLRLALERLADEAEAYMHYHSEKFYSDLEVKPTGLYPQIALARAVLAAPEAKS